MLTALRQILRSKWIGGIVFGLIILSMAVWIDDPTSFLGSGLNGKAVRAGDRGFTIEEFDGRVEQFLQRQRDQGGTLISRRVAVEQGAVDQLFSIEASRAANLGYAARIGAVSSTEAVRSAILEDDVFADPATGEFDRQTYSMLLRRNQLTETQYERELRDNLSLDLLSGAATAALMPPASYTQLQAAYLAESRTVSWFTVSTEDAGEPAEPATEALDAFYQSNLASFQIPERRMVSLIELSADDFFHRVDVRPEDIRALYEAQKTQRFSSPETRRFTQVTATSREAALDALGRLAAGEDAASLDSPSIRSVDSRTSLRAALASSELAEAVFSPAARPGAVDGPISQGDTWIVIRLDEIIPGTPIPFEDVSAQIADEYRRREADGLFRAAEAELYSMIGAGLTLDEMASQLGSPVFTYMPITASGRLLDGTPIIGITGNGDLIEAVFAARPGEVTDPVDGENGLYLAEVREIFDPRTPPLEEIRDDVVAVFSAQQRNESLSTFASGLVGRIQSGEQSMSSAAEAVGAGLQRTDRAISRANYESNLPEAALVPVFGGSEGDVFTVPGPRSGEITIARIDTVTRPDPTEVSVLSGTVRGQIREGLSSDMRTAMESLFRETLEFRADGNALAAYKQQILDQQ